jgi:hypothetical protein
MEVEREVILAVQGSGPNDSEQATQGGLRRFRTPEPRLAEYLQNAEGQGMINEMDMSDVGTHQK